MTTTCSPAAKDDPMDLGPFLQEYVLQNPFSMRMSKLTSTLGPLPKKSPPVLPAMKPVPPGGCSPLPLQPVVPSTASYGTENGQSPVLIKIEEDGDQDFIVTEDSGKVVDTPKGHIGSNATFAEMLKANLLPPKHVKVRNWLLRHYSYFPSYGGWISSEELLRDVKRLFTHMKSCILSRIIRFTFPDSRKIVNKYGYFYEGLLRKPKAADFKNAELIEAVQMTEMGEVGVGDMAKKFRLSEIAITNMRLWRYHSKQCGNDLDDHNIDTTSQSEELEDELDEEESDNVENTPLDEDPDWDAAGIKPSERYPILRWKLCCRAKRQREGAPARKRRKLAQSQDQDSQMDEENKDVGSPSQHSGSSGGESSQESNHGSSPSKEKTTEQMGKGHRAVYSSQEECLDLSGKVRIKEEPVDTDFKDHSGEHRADRHTAFLENSYKSSSSSLQTRLSRRLAQVDKANCGNVASQKSAMPKPSFPSHTLGLNSRGECTVNSLADLLSSRQVIHNLRRELEERDQRLLTCNSELIEAKNEIAHLKNQLSVRESQLTSLAEEFFQLSNQFMKLSRNFKQVVGEMETKSNK